MNLTRSRPQPPHQYHLPASPIPRHSYTINIQHRFSFASRFNYLLSAIKPIPALLFPTSLGRRCTTSSTRPLWVPGRCWGQRPSRSSIPRSSYFILSRFFWLLTLARSNVSSCMDLYFPGWTILHLLPCLTHCLCTYTAPLPTYLHRILAWIFAAWDHPLHLLPHTRAGIIKAHR